MRRVGEVDGRPQGFRRSPFDGVRPRQCSRGLRELARAPPAVGAPLRRSSISTYEAARGRGRSRGLFGELRQHRGASAALQGALSALGLSQAEALRGAECRRSITAFEASVGRRLGLVTDTRSSWPRA